MMMVWSQEAQINQNVSVIIYINENIENCQYEWNQFEDSLASCGNVKLNLHKII